MGRMPAELRETIARNIRACRVMKFPGRGGGKRCAETFGVSPQQWSPWERGLRTPDESRLLQIANFFEVTVEFLRTAKQPASSDEPASPSIHNNDKKLHTADGNPHTKHHYPHHPFPITQPGTAESFYWLAYRFLNYVENHSLRLDPQSMHWLVQALRG